MTQDIVVCCSTCTSQVPINQTTYGNDGKSLICFGCYNNIVKGIEPYKTVQSSDMPERIDFVCNYCSHEFSRSPGFETRGICFNCGKRGLQIKKRLIGVNRKDLLDY